MTAEEASAAPVAAPGPGGVIPLEDTDRLALENLYLRRQNHELSGRLLAAESAQVQRRLRDKYVPEGTFTVDLEHGVLRLLPGGQGDGE